MRQAALHASASCGQGASNARRKCLGRFLGDPAGAAIERFERSRLVDMNHRVELARQHRLEAVTDALGFRQVYDADRTLQSRSAEGIRQILVMQQKGKRRKIAVVEELLLAAG